MPARLVEPSSPPGHNELWSLTMPNVDEIDEIRSALNAWVRSETALVAMIEPLAGPLGDQPPPVLSRDRVAAIAAAMEQRDKLQADYVEACKRFGWPYPHPPADE